MKRLFVLLLTLVMVLTLAACGGDEEKAPSNDDKTPSSSKQQEEKAPAADKAEDTEAAEPSDPNAPVSSVGNAAGRGSYTKHNAEDAQELLVAMGLPEYPGGEILYANEFEEGDGTVYIKDTTLDECVSYCGSLSGVSPAYADSNSNGKYVNYACEGSGFAFTIKFFAEEQEKSYTMNGSPATDVWQAEIDFTPTGSGSGSGDATGGPVIAEGWEIPEYPYGELVYTEYDDSGMAVALYFNNTTIEECHEYCITLESAGYMEVFNNEIHEDDDGLGRWMDYIGMHPSSYINYQVDYPSENVESTVDTPDGEVIYQLIIRNRGK